MVKVSIIIPVFKEPYLNKTIDSLLENCVEDVEIIPVFDGMMPEEPLPKDSRIKPVYLEENRGMRGAINAGLIAATGEFIAKIDAHCIVAYGFDKELVESCKENWLMIPRRYSLKEEGWCIDGTRYARDYHYFSFPEPSGHGRAIFIGEWHARDKERKDVIIDDTLAFQGSFWFANRKYFMSHVGFLDDRERTYGSIAEDQLEIGLKYWLNGGEPKVHKGTWYAHLSKRGHHYHNKVFSRLHKKDQQYIDGSEWATSHWMNNEEPGMQETFQWLIKKFEPPTWENYNNLIN